MVRLMGGGGKQQQPGIKEMEVLLAIFPAPTPFSLHNSEGLVAGADHASRSNSEGNKAE